MALSYRGSLSRYRKYLMLVQSQPVWAASMWVIMSLVLMIVLLIFALRPTLVTISGLMGQIKQQQEVATALEGKINTIQTAIDLLEKTNDKVPHLNTLLPATAQWNALATEIEKIATESGVSTDSVMVDKVPLAAVEVTNKNFSKPLMPTGVLPIRFSITVKGELKKIMEMVNRIEKMDRLIVLSDVQIQIQKNAPGFQSTITGEAGYAPDIQPAI